MKLPRPLRRKPHPQAPENHPPYVRTAEQRRRWDLAAAIAEGIFGDTDQANVWSATRALYQGPIPTDDLDSP